MLSLMSTPVVQETETLQALAELFGSLTFGQMCGVISGFVLFIVMTVLACKGKLPFEHKVEDFIEEAKRNGNVVNGHRTSLLMRDTGDGDRDLIKDRQYTGVYDFEIDGKKRTSVVLLGVDPPLDINVYYSRKNGRLKIMTDYNHPDRKPLTLVMGSTSTKPFSPAQWHYPSQDVA